MNADQVIKEAGILVSRYRVPYDMREDLLHEAIVAGLSALENGGDESKIITDMRKALYAYTNWKSLAVSIPDNGNTYTFKLQMDRCDYDKLSHTEKALYHALRADRVTEEETLGLEAQDEHTGLLLSLAVDQILDEEQSSVFRKIAFMGYTKQEVGVSMGKSRQWVAKTYLEACKKIEERLYSVTKETH